MDHWLLRQDCRSDRFMTMAVEGVVPDAFRTGRLVEDPGEPLRVFLVAGATLESDFLETPCFVVSGRMRRALSNAGVDNIQYFPAHLQREFSTEWITDYWLGNVLGCVACADPERSTEGDPEGGRLRGFRIDAGRALDLSLFRLAEDPRVVAVHERVRRACHRADLQGLFFQDPATYDGYAVSTERKLEPRSEDGEDAGQDPS